jgi:hypothetical protein
MKRTLLSRIHNKLLVFQGGVVYLKVLGWMCILIEVMLLAPSIVPGAMSAVASFIAILILVISIVTIKTGNLFYFKFTAVISGISIFIVNDSLRLYGSLPQVPWEYQVSFYSLFIIICSLAIYYAKRRAGVMKNYKKINKDT